MRQRPLVLAVAAALALPATGWADSIATDRPGSGSAPAVMSPWRLQIETAAMVGFSGETTTASLPTLVRLGLIERLEVRLGNSIAGFISPPGGADDDLQLTDSLIGAKVYVTDQRGAIPQLAALVDVTLPTGGGSFTADAVVPDMRLAAIWGGLPGELSVLVNLGAAVPDDADGRHTRLILLGSLGRGITDRLFAFVEGFGFVDPSGDRGQVVLAEWGLTYLLGDDVQLDLFGQHGLTDTAPDFQLSLGFSARL